MVIPLSALLVSTLHGALWNEAPSSPITPEMVLVEKGCFNMGTPSGEKDERPHKVCLEGFYIGKYEVTFEEYDRFAQATNRPLPKDDGFGRGRYPVSRVSWEEAYRYAQWLSAKTGQHYRLPTEAEWEYAARAGLTAPDLGHGNLQQLCPFVNYKDCPNSPQHSAPVGQYQPNPWGLHDVLGNVEELTASTYDPDYGGGELLSAPPDDQSRRVRRGGSWAYAASSLRFANRDKTEIHLKHNVLGFRLARD